MCPDIIPSCLVCVCYLHIWKYVRCCLYLKCLDEGKSDSGMRLWEAAMMEFFVWSCIHVLAKKYWWVRSLWCFVPNLKLEGALFFLYHWVHNGYRPTQLSLSGIQDFVSCGIELVRVVLTACLFGLWSCPWHICILTVISW